MILGIGCDIIDIHRIEAAYKRLGTPFLQRIFSEEELKYCLAKKNPFPSLASRFTAKEAISKALGCGITSLFGWKDSWIHIDTSGKPCMQISKKCRAHFGDFVIHVSLSHTDSTAMAMVILEQSEKKEHPLLS